MFEQRLLENVKEGEEVLALVRRTPLVVVAPTLLIAVFIIAPFFFLYPLLKYGTLGVIVVILSVGVGVFLGLRTMWVHQFNVFILTATRIVDVDQRGFFHRVVSETISALNLSGVLVVTDWLFSAASSLLASGFLAIVPNSAASLLTMAAGVRAGATIPSQLE